MIVFIDDISICSSRNKEYEEHLRLILDCARIRDCMPNSLSVNSGSFVPDFSISTEQKTSLLLTPHIMEWYTLMQKEKVKLPYGMKRITFTNHKRLQHILDQKELKMRPRRLLRFLSDFDCKIRYHPGKASVAANALRRNERAKPPKVRALVMTINSNLPPQINKAQVESLKTENVKDENLHGMDKELRLVLIELPALGVRVGYHALET
ncbi:hypothetical protein Tco_0962224 [Tanacetum coccineum]